MEDNRQLMIKISHVSKEYKLGQFGSTTLRDELQRKRAKIRGEEDPTRKINAKTYTDGESFMALEDINLEIRKGERVGIIGHNGAGKSTLLKIISRITAPKEGYIGLNGRVASMLEVGTGFHSELTGRENIYLNGAVLGMTRKEIDSKIEDIIEFSECRQFIDTPVKRYSSGMYVKLAFAVAAHLDSEIMIMDEVLAVGDMQFQKKCLAKMRELAEEHDRTILYVSHNMNTIRELCDRCIVIDSGHLIFDGDVNEAISLYLDEEHASLSAVHDLKDKERTSRNPSGKMRFNSVEILNDIPLKLRDKLSLKIKWKSFDPQIKEIYMRVLIDSDKGNAAVATSEKANVTVGLEHTGILNIDTSVLGPGKYQLTLQFIDNSPALHDSVRALGFEVVHDASRVTIPYKYTGWGNILLPEMEWEEEK